MGVMQTAALCVQHSLRLLVLCPAVILHEAVFPADGRQPGVGVVLTEGQAVLAAAGHHPVGVHDALGHKVIHQCAEIARLPGQDELAFAQCVPGSVQTGQQALRGGFLVARGAVELSRTVESPHHLAFQRGFEAGGVYAVVLDGVGRAHDLNILEALDAPVECILHIFRQTAGRTLQIHFLGVLPARLHEDGMPVLSCKPHHLVLNRRAVARADALDHAAVERAALDIVQNDPVRLRVGVGDPALHLVVHRGIGHEAERLKLIVRVAGLAFQLGEVDAPPMHPGRRTGLEAAQRQTGGFQALGEGVGRVHPVGAGSVPCIAHKNFSAEVGAGGDDHALCAILPVQLGNDALHMAVLHLDGNDFRLMDGQPRRQLKGVLHIFMIALAVGLDAQSVDSGTFALVEHPAL